MRALGLTLLLAVAAAAQDPWEGTPLDRARIEEALRETRARLAGLPEAEQPPYKAREDLLSRLLATVAEREGLLGAAAIRERRVKADASLVELRARPPIPLPTALTKEAVAGFEEEFKSAEAGMKAAAAALEQLQQRQKQLREEAAALPARLAEVKQRLAGSAAQDTLNRGNLALEQRLLEERADLARNALARWEERLPMEQAEHDLARLRHERAKDAHARVLAAFVDEQKAQAERDRERAAAEEKAAKEERDPLERFRKETLAEISRCEASRKADEAFLKAAEQRAADEGSLLERLQTDRQRLQDRFGTRGGSSAVAGAGPQATVARLERERESLRQKLSQLEQEFAAYQAARVAVEDRLWDLEAPLDDNEALLDLVRTGGEPRAAEARQLFSDVVLGNEGLVSKLRARAATLAKIDLQLAELESRYEARLDENEELQAFIQTRLYWIRSDPPISVAVLRAAAEEAVRLPARLGRRESLAALGLVVAIVLLVVGARRSSGKDERSYRGGPVLAALQRILVALLLSAPLPALAWIAARLVGFLGLPEEALVRVARSLDIFAALLFALAFLQRFLAAEGLAVKHLKVRPAVATQILRCARTAIYAAVLFFVPYRALGSLAEPPANLMRLFHVAFIGGTAVALGLLVRRKGPVADLIMGRGGLRRRAWMLLAPLLMLGLLAILALDVVGYGRGARFLLASAVQTLVAVLVLAGLYHLLRQAVEKVALSVRKQAVAAEGYAAAWQQSRAVTQQLTRVVTVAILAVAALLISGFWDVGTTVDDFFAHIVLTTVGETPLTLWDVITAALWIGGAHFVVAHLRGVYEYLVFPLFTGADRGGQFVLLTLSRYVILLVAYSAALLSLHFSFASLGWLLAAASVGLGFGLQEIVANFVSGLILLLERPIRVGDIITVGDTGGTVEKINIRATVVTNWDHQQIIVPNKVFVTENLTNWTRNDMLMRRKILVGVAYGSDVEKVLRILGETVAAHPKVAKEPPQRIWFEAFGESSLDFEVWFFCPIQEGKQVLTEIRTAIAKRFAEEGIEIPFPQRDLHVRSVETPDMFGALLERPPAGR